MFCVQAEVERVQHGFNRGVEGLEGSKGQLEQKLREEKEASRSILEYLEKHYNVRPSSQYSRYLIPCSVSQEIRHLIQRDTFGCPKHPVCIIRTPRLTNKSILSSVPSVSGLERFHCMRLQCYSSK